MTLTPEQHEALIRQLNVWRDLEKHEGWKAFEVEMRRNEEALLVGVMKLGGSPHDMALQLGSLKVARDFRSFVQRNIETCEQVLRTHEEAVKLGRDREQERAKKR